MKTNVNYENSAWIKWNEMDAEKRNCMQRRMMEFFMVCVMGNCNTKSCPYRHPPLNREDPEEPLLLQRSSDQPHYGT